MAADMNNLNRTHTSPLPVPRTRRNHDIGVITSLQAGKCVPVFAAPILREDSFAATVNITCEMLETHELIANPVRLRMTFFAVPYLAFSRFEGSRDQLDRSYMGEPKVEGGTVVPFFNTATAGATAPEILKYLGMPVKSGEVYNTAYIEAYNEVWNFRAKNRSPDITLINPLTNTALLGAFWQHSRFAHVVPDFDQAVMDGTIPLWSYGQDGKVPIKGNLVTAGYDETRGQVNFYREHTPATNVSLSQAASVNTLTTNNSNTATPTTLRPYVNLNAIYADLVAEGVRLSLADIESARKTQTFAQLRNMYSGLDDEFIIDMLMDGLTVPDQYLKQPILLADRTVRFGQAKRYATNSDDLAASAVSGGVQLSMNVRMPRLSTGGVVIGIAEAVPDQLFERQRDPLMGTLGVSTLPEFLRDHLDPEKVDQVLNGEIDVEHSSAASTFGYAPLNWKWTSFPPRVGGKFYWQGAAGANSTERSRFWAVETPNPVLSRDFYVVSSMHLNPFLDTTKDPFEMGLVGNAVIEGNTVFGNTLIEATDNYAQIMAEVPWERIDKDGGTTTAQVMTAIKKGGGPTAPKGSRKPPVTSNEGEAE